MQRRQITYDSQRTSAGTKPHTCILRPNVLHAIMAVCIWECELPFSPPKHCDQPALRTVLANAFLLECLLQVNEVNDPAYVAILLPISIKPPAINRHSPGVHGTGCTRK